MIAASKNARAALMPSSAVIVSSSGPTAGILAAPIKSTAALTSQHAIASTAAGSLRLTETIRDMNHHIRNALHTIALASYIPQNQETVKAIDDSLHRVDWALREILPKL